MNNIIFYDTETTKKLDFKSPPDAPHQPRLIQLGFIMTDVSGYECAHFSCLIKPDGWTIDPAAQAVHGITLDMCEQMGIPLNDALAIFAKFVRLCKGLVCYNSDFDSAIMIGEILRTGNGLQLPPHFCQMKAMTQICRLPGPYGFKWPKLQEAYRHCFGKEFDGAHNAFADVKATKDCYFWLKNQKQKQG